MSRHRSLGTASLALALVTVLAACGGQSSSPSASSASSEKKSPVILMNWFAQAEQGGYWDALSHQYAEEDGVTISLKQGGPGVLPIPQVAAGEATFGVANADAILVARENGLPVVALAAAFDTNLQCLMYHSGKGINSFADLNGRQIAALPVPFFEYIKKEFKLDNIKQVNYTGSMANFAANPDLVQQCFVTSEPFVAKGQGINAEFLGAAKDAGYNPYGNALFTTEKVIKEDPDMVRAVVSAAVEGWTHFATDPADAKAEVLKANKNADPEVFDFAASTLVKEGYIGSPTGTMTDERWKELRDQVASVGLVKADLDYTKAFTTEYLPK